MSLNTEEVKDAVPELIKADRSLLHFLLLRRSSFLID
jgi:hypothetical protein